MNTQITYGWLASICLLAVVAGCNESNKISDPPYEQDPTLVILHEACPIEERIGGFLVQMNEDMGYTSVDGVVKNGIVPGYIPDITLEEGDCRLLARRNLFCDPACTSGFTCGTDQTCIPMPLGQDMGKVILRGLAKRLELNALQPGNSYSWTQLPYPGYEVDQVIQLRTISGYLGALELYGIGVSQLVPSESAWVITEGQDLIIEWEPPQVGARSRVLIEINIDQHGLTPLTLNCDMPDTGSATIPQAIIDGLMEAGVTGFPIGRVTRRTTDSYTAAEGCIDFFISSVRTITVEVAGHTPCTNNDDCTTPEICDLDPLIQQCYTPCTGPENCTLPQTCNESNKCE
jgi:hypothetical protein